MTNTFDFQDGNGPVPAHQHPSGGGWVADTATVADTAFVGPNAWVFGNACVYGNALVCDEACVFGNAQVSGNARVFGNAQVYGNARVYGEACVCGDARVYGEACVCGDARVYGEAIVKDSKFPQIKRSDGYDFIAVPCFDGETRVIAGCHYFTFKEAKKHWKETLGGTPLGDETMLILKFLKKYVKMQEE